MAGILVCSVSNVLNGARLAAEDPGQIYTIDPYSFQTVLVIGFVCALFDGLFFGTDYSDGTLRNKIIIGHTRTAIYLANLICAFAISMLFLAAWTAGTLVGIPMLGFWKMGEVNLLICLLILIMALLAFSALYTMIAMLVSSRTMALLVSVILFSGLLLLAASLYNALGEPETSSGFVMGANGNPIVQSMPNPKYVSGFKRDLYDMLIDCLPTGQGIRLWQLEVAHPLRMILFSAAVTVVSTLLGLLAFRKKDLK